MPSFTGIKRNGNIFLAMEGEEFLIIHNYHPSEYSGEYICSSEVRIKSPREAATTYHTAVSARDIRHTTRELEALLSQQKTGQKRHQGL